MRLNRGTIVLLVISLVIIVAVVFINNNQANQPQAITPTPAEGSALYPELTANDVLSVTVRDNQTGAFTRVARADSDSDWEVTGPEDAAAHEVDPDAVIAAVNDLVSLESVSVFEADNLADFRLAEPAYTIEVDSGAPTLEVILVGGRNPAGNRYYILTRQAEAQAEATEEATEEAAAAGGGTVQLVSQLAIQSLIDLVSRPPFQPTATPTATATATLNPMSEVEMATATAGANATATAVMATIAAEATAEVTAEATAEATAETADE